MAQLEIITKPTAVYSENILPISAMFEDTATINQAGSAPITVSQILTSSFEGSKSINIFCNTDPVLILSKTFNFGNDITCIAKRTGQHIFSMKLKNKTVFDTDFTFQINAYLYVNGLLTETYITNLTLGVANKDNWITLAQSFSLTAGDTFNMTFEAIKPPSPEVNPNISVDLDGFKLEFDDRFLGIPSVYSLPSDAISQKNDLMLAETQWNVPDIGTQVIANGGVLNLLTLINNVTHKNLTNSDVYDQLDITSNSIKTTYRGGKIIHLIRVSLNIIAGVEQYYQLQIRRTIDNSIVYRHMLQRNPDETIQTIEMTTRTLSDTDPFVVDGFYIALVNNSGSSATIDDELSLLVISTYQKAQKV